jgi:3-hydroxyisobutyrate dehydrogenase-like beta-hydroxyacid dehydrogenase
MGQRMAVRLVDAGYDVVVWSRSGVPDSVPALASRAAVSPRAAVRGADVVFSMLRDDEASQRVWLGRADGALAGMRKGALAVECSTLTPAHVSQLAASARSASIEFIEAPVVGSRPQAESGSLVFLAGGDALALDRARPILARMGSQVHHLGATPAGANAKLFVNALFGVQVAALAELLGFAKAAQLDLEKLFSALETLPVLSSAAKGAAVGMLARRFESMFPVQLVSKDLRYVLAAAEAVSSSLPVTRSVGDVFNAAMAAGLADENLTATAKLYA